MDFFKINERSSKNGTVEVYPDFRIMRSKDLMVRAKSFYAIWDEKRGLWSRDEYDVQRLVDEKLQLYGEELQKRTDSNVRILYMGYNSTGLWQKFQTYLKNLSDNAHELDTRITFLNTVVSKEDYVSKRLPYPLTKDLDGKIEAPEAYDKIMSTLYEPKERDKIEWAIGSIISGESKNIQKFLVLYGSGGTGKGTVLQLVQRLFEGYTTAFEAKSLTTSSNAFSTSQFSTNPLVAIDADGDLSKIEDNHRLNSIVSHEDMVINEKFKPSYTARVNAFVMMGTNKPVKITDAKSGLIRRLIDVRPTGKKIPEAKYFELIRNTEFELGSIAAYCLQKFESMGADYYSSYKPIDMMYQTDYFYNFVVAHYDLFIEQNGVSLVQAYNLYKAYCDESGIEFKMNRLKLRDELKNYFENFEERTTTEDGSRVRNWFSGLITSRFEFQPDEEEVEEVVLEPLVLEETVSILDDILKDRVAQYSKEDGTPSLYWSDSVKIRQGKEYYPKPYEVVSTVLADLDTSKEHYVKPPLNHIVIDFDLTNDDGEKDAEKNLRAAAKWPKTYAEFSKGGAGVHLHYIYDGDPKELSRLFDEGIEVKVFVGDSSLRRRLSKCVNNPIARISGGLPLKEKKMTSGSTLASEKSLRELIFRNLRKEIHPATKPSMDFIKKILDDAYDSGLEYDVTDMRSRIMSFANNSTNQSLYCLSLLPHLKLVGKESEKVKEKVEDRNIVIFDVEVFKNVWILSYSPLDSETVTTFVNPSPQQIEELLDWANLVGFNNRQYDNHILYGAYMGYDNTQIYNLSQRLINNDRYSRFGEAYNLSYADLYELFSEKSSLKKFQIKYNLPHVELSHPWEEPLPEELLTTAIQYCENDVKTTKEVLKLREFDWRAREILAALSGLEMNEKTQDHTAAIIFGGDRDARNKFVYTDLSEQFPGYEFDGKVSTYKGKEPSEGGYVYSEPGFYTNVGLFDVASMHPTSLVELNYFGPYTHKFKDLLDARLAIKHGQLDKAKKMLDGKLEPFLQGEVSADLSFALKIAINIVYGMTSAKYPNAFRMDENVDNIVAKRGALFMIDLQEYVESLGYKVVHIKTDSIKIPDIDDKIFDLVSEFGKKYGYDFEHEQTFSRFALKNKALYAGKDADTGEWDVVGAPLNHPVVVKTLFTNEPIVASDYGEFKNVVGAQMYLRFKEDELQYIGRNGLFVPVTSGGADLVRISDKGGKPTFVQDTKGFKWLPADLVFDGEGEHLIDQNYYRKLIDKQIEELSEFGDVEWLRKG